MNKENEKELAEYLQNLNWIMSRAPLLLEDRTDMKHIGDVVSMLRSIRNHPMYFMDFKPLKDNEEMLVDFMKERMNHIDDFCEEVAEQTKEGLKDSEISVSQMLRLLDDFRAIAELKEFDDSIDFQKLISDKETAFAASYNAVTKLLYNAMKDYFSKK